MTLNSDVIKYCPHCGKQSFQGLTSKKFECCECGFKLYLNAASAVAALVLDTTDKLLIVIRKNDPAKGSWDLPGGFVDPGESAEDALKREIKEELNLDITDLDYFGSFPNTYKFEAVIYKTLDITFVCHVDDFDNISAADDVDSFLFCPLDHVDPQRFGLDSMKIIVSKFLREKVE